MNTSNSIIEKIHSEASTAETKLIANADRILKQASDKDTVERVNELQRLGFSSFKEAVELSPEQVEKVKSLKELISLYRVKAPTTKFMTDEAVKELCEKYGLVQAPVNVYIDRIPEKNQKEILDFKIDKSFLRNSYMSTVEVGEWEFSHNNKKRAINFAGLLSSKKKNKTKGHNAMAAVEFITKNWDDESSRRIGGTQRRKGILKAELANGKSEKEIMRTYSDIIVSALKCALHHGHLTQDDLSPASFASVAALYDESNNVFQTIGYHPCLVDAVARLKEGMQTDSMELRIIAPKHMLNLEGYEINENCQAMPKGYEFTSPNVKEWFVDDDPIVQVKVKGGWLNVTAWGAEAEHPEGFNEQLN